jgi:hypothetical protein
VPGNGAVPLGSRYLNSYFTANGDLRDGDGVPPRSAEAVEDLGRFIGRVTTARGNTAAEPALTRAIRYGDQDGVATDYWR